MGKIIIRKNSILKSFATLIMGMAAMLPLYAESAEHEHNIYTPITTIVSFASVRPAWPESQNKMLVSFSDMSWMPSECHQTYAYVESSDTVLVSSLLSAFAAGKSVRAIVDTSMKLDNIRCRIVYAFIKN